MEMKGLICYENNFRHQVWGLGGWEAHPIALTVSPPVKEASPKGTKFTHSGCRGLTWITGLKGRGGAFFVLQGCLLTYSPSRNCCGLIQAVLRPHRLLWGPLSSPRLLPPSSPSSQTPPTCPPRAHAHCSPRLRPTWPVLGALLATLSRGGPRCLPSGSLATGAGAPGKRTRQGLRGKRAKRNGAWLGDDWEPRS